MEQGGHGMGVGGARQQLHGGRTLPLRPAPGLSSRHPPPGLTTFCKTEPSSTSRQERNYGRGSSGLRRQAEQISNKLSRDRKGSEGRLSSPDLTAEPNAHGSLHSTQGLTPDGQSWKGGTAP